MAYADLTREQLTAIKVELEAELGKYRARDLKLNMARGKPSSEQLELSTDMLTMFKSSDDLFSENGVDCRNYGELEGIDEARRIMAVLLDDDMDNVVVGGNSSLTLMYNSIARFMGFGARGSRPWDAYDQIKWICPA